MQVRYVVSGIELGSEFVCYCHKKNSGSSGCDSGDSALFSARGPKINNIEKKGQ